MPGIINSKTVLVVGATAGIGRALALAIHQLPSRPTVILAGRRKERLDALVAHGKTAGGGRLVGIQVDVDAGRDALRSFAKSVVADFPDLDTVIFSAGIQHRLDFTKPEELNLDHAASEFNVNYVAILNMITFFLPHLLKLGSQGRPTFIVPISSGLAITPSPGVPGYCATKAALHSLCLSLQAQLKDKNVHVMEIIPPLVESELHDHQGTTPMLSKFWMPLDEYTQITMEGLKRGDAQIMPPQIQAAYDRFEKGKAEFVAQQMSART